MGDRAVLGRRREIGAGAVKAGRDMAVSVSGG